jgi:protein TonB
MGHKKKRILQSAISLVVHTGVLSALVILPLLISNTLSLQQLDRTFLIAPPPPAAPAPPRPVAVHADASKPKFNPTAAKLSIPTVIPKTIEMSAPEVAMAPAMQSAGGVFGGLGSVLGGDTTAGPPPPPPVAAAPKKPLVITGTMKQPVLTFAPALVYPPIAKAAHASGTVEVVAVIDEHGNVVEVHAVSGPALLMQAALYSVSKRKYQPTILDGQPTPIVLHVEVNFRLSDT